MRHSSLAMMAGSLLAAGMWLAAPAYAHAADSPLVGTWKIVVLPPGRDVTLWLVKIEDKAGKPQASLVAASFPDLKETKTEIVSADAKTLRMTLKTTNMDLSLVAMLPAGEAMPKKLHGTLLLRTQYDLMVMERTDVKELNPEKAIAEDEATQKALRLEDLKEQEKALLAIVEKPAGQASAVHAANQLFNLTSAAGKEDKEIQARADKLIALVAPFGREMELQIAARVAQVLTRTEESKDEAKLGLEYSQKAVKLLQDSDPLEMQQRILQTLVQALKKAKKADEVKAVEARLAKLEDGLDQEFLKKVPPFKPEPFAGRKGKSDRVAVVELFTGTMCPPCVAADVAFDAATKTFKPSDVIFLQYHLHIPGPDPLTNKDAVKRSEFYEVEGTPAMFLSGLTVERMGGGMQHAEERFKRLRAAIEDKLETQSMAKLKVTADRKGTKLDVTAEVADLQTTGEQVRLRFVLVEKEVRYPAPNGMRFHHYVVRALPGGAEGFALPAKTGKQTVRVELADLKKSLDDYLTDFAKTDEFPSADRPLDLKHLKVIALIQDNRSKEILHAALVDVAE